jgi:hypothetical protein|tara:strand:+ start:65 stop:334 length:270 start_codon:yes stop_codon:yes gene_type:complete
MAPKRMPRHKLRRSARNYRDNPESRKKKNASQRRRNKLKINKKYRAELNRARRKAGQYGKGGKDFSHTKRGKLVRENASKNRARNRSRK